MTTPGPRSTRRWFLRMLALAPALPLFAFTRQAFAQGAPPPPTPATPTPAPAAPAATELSPDVGPLTQVLQRRYGAHLSTADLEGLAPDLDRHVKLGERLRKVKLENSEEPDFVFRAAPRPAAPVKGGRHARR